MSDITKCFHEKIFATFDIVLKSRQIYLLHRISNCLGVSSSEEETESVSLSEVDSTDDNANASYSDPRSVMGASSSVTWVPMLEHRLELLHVTGLFK